MACQFDDFVFDRERGLLQDGVPVPLEPQAFDLLGYLLDHRDRVVTRDELIERIWDGRIVSEAALSTQIRSVRRALGDDRASQSYIRTYPKRGFQFVADVEVVEPGIWRDASTRPAGTPSSRRFGLWSLAGALVLAVGLGFAWSVRGPGQSEERPRNLSIAVLPFDNLSGDPEQDYFADAITEDLITDLSRIRDAFVIARRTSFTYKARSVDIATVAKELNVRYILEGSVRRTGDEVRINAQLIDGETNSHVWSDRFDRTLTDVFSAQNDVTGRIAAVLKAELREAETRHQRPEASLEAWDYALRGNVLLFNPKGIEGYQAAKALLDRAIEIDPGISSAWSGLAFIHFVASQVSIPGVTVPNSKDLSLAAALRAVELDPKNAEGHWMIGVGYARNGQPELGMASCETAVDLNPNNDCAYVCTGLANMALGKPEAAIPNFQQSLRLNPRFRPFTKYKYMGLAYLQSGQDAAAIDALTRAIAGSPNDSFANFMLAAAIALSNRAPDAREALQTASALPESGGTTIDSMRASYGWMGPGFDRVLDGLQTAGMPAH